MGAAVNVAVEPAGPKRVPCPLCGAEIIAGARKCRYCRRWIGEPPPSPSRFSRSLTLIVAAVVAVLAVLLSSRESPVGEAPPLTPIMAGSSVGEADVQPGAAPQVLGPDADGQTPAPVEPPPDGTDEWHTRRLQLDVHPLDLLFSPNGNTLYVSGDDASIREYDLQTGKLLHMASVPAQGDRIRLLADRYIALIRRHEAAHIPLLDTTNWDRDPVLLWVGSNPADVVALPDGKTIVAASSRGKRLTWFELDKGRRKSDIRLPHTTRKLYLLQTSAGPTIGAIGTLVRAGRPAGAWIDLFDPTETPFGATRRSVSVGRDPHPGAVTGDHTALFFADHVSNTASLLSVDANTETKTVTVGQGPIAAFLLSDDRYGITLDSDARTATVVGLADMKRLSTLMLNGSPSHGASAADGSRLFIALGGTTWPPKEAGAAIVAGDPPKVVATLDTDRGAARVAVSPDGYKAAIANHFAKTITVIEP
ncbi:MAG: hypothetical protein JRI68_27270 [Deltaproteobacteria bacterium]|nr:hypothetical protein [Deltaproteobacteria bacterium]